MRVEVERTISKLKKFRIIGEEFRNRLPHYDIMTSIVSGIVNMRMLGTANQPCSFRAHYGNQSSFYPKSVQLCLRSIHSDLIAFIGSILEALQAG
ncbi:MAG: hypothetical protein JRN20_09490 [Nitrososphaerota archaeon]|nr:hypothetical protein [Nitrososphaerota archaeon]